MLIWMVLTVDSVTPNPKMRRWVAPKQGRKYLMPRAAYHTGTAKITGWDILSDNRPDVSRGC